MNTLRIPREHPSAEWIRQHYGVPAQKHRRIAYTGDKAKGRQLGTIVGFVTGGHLRIRLDGERHHLTSHPTWEIEYLPEMANERTCEQCGRTGTRGFKVMPARCVSTSVGLIRTAEFTECANRRACQRRWPKRPQDDD
jgi:hypothetical protein